MVTLSKIYTRTGDRGQTRLGDGTQVPKTHARIEAYGCVDELNAVLGLLLAAGVEEAIRPLLQEVQNDLFDLGADLCVPAGGGQQVLRLQATQVERLERAIDRFNEALPVLKSFVLPGGHPAAAWLHLARTVCRRAERRLWALAADEPLNEEALAYVNRLSDLFFVLARVANQGEGDVLWVPGKTQREEEE